MNPYWQYSRDKAACESLLMKHFREDDFPVTIVRPSHTYGERSVPVGVHGIKGSWQVLKRMLDGKPVLIQGDGSSLWTMTWNEDFARGYIGLVGNPRALGEAFHITSDESLTWNQIHETIAATLGVPLKPCHVASDFLSAVAPKPTTWRENSSATKPSASSSTTRKSNPWFRAFTPKSLSPTASAAPSTTS